MVFLETFDILNAGGYSINNGTFIKLKQDFMIRNTKLFSEKISASHNNMYSTIVEVCNEDTFDCAGRMSREGCVPCVLNMCSDRHAGGTVAWSGKAQEETLVCRSTLIKSLYKFAKDKDINVRNLVYYRPNLFDSNYGAIYSPDVSVFRGSDYSLLDKPFKVAVVSIPAINNPKKNSIGDLFDTELDVIKNKIRTILNVAIVNNHSNIVLGAFGCGAYNNPPKLIATLFKDVLQEENYCNAFNKVYFAILGDENYNVFLREFFLDKRNNSSSRINVKSGDINSDK